MTKDETIIDLRQQLAYLTERMRRQQDLQEGCYAAVQLHRSVADRYRTQLDELYQELARTRAEVIKLAGPAELRAAARSHMPGTHAPARESLCLPQVRRPAGGAAELWCGACGVAVYQWSSCAGPTEDGSATPAEGVLAWTEHIGGAPGAGI